MGTVAAEKNLLFGLLALQVGLIDQSKLVAAFHAWTLDRNRPLAEHLVAQGHLRVAERPAVEALVALHVEKHGDVERSLAAIPADRSTRAKLAGLGDAEIDATLPLVASGSGSTEPDGDANRTRDYSVGAASDDGLRFRVMRPHAQGGLGAVFVALDTQLHREVALKQILDSHADDPASRARFVAEAEITGGLEHPGIVPVYGLGLYADGRPYYAMRFIRGESLKEAIDRFHAAKDSDSGRRSLQFYKLMRRFTDVCNAVEYAHSRGVLHRDIKPSNIIVGDHGETLVVDWGLAKAIGRPETASDERSLRPSSASGSAETLPGSVLGTPGYMSPEQAAGNLDSLGPWSDVYSLGATLYCLLVGGPPFAGDAIEVIRLVREGHFQPPRALDPSIDRALEAICLRAMARLPEERYGSCRALAEDIERWMADEPVSAWREPLPRRARRWARRHRTSVAAGLFILLAGFVGLGAAAGVQARANGHLRDANAATRHALAETKAAQVQTQAALKESEESRTEAEAVSTFLVDAFRSSDPTKTTDGRTIKVVDVLDRASARLAKGFSGSQATLGTLLESLGKTYQGLGLYDKAADLHGKARAVRASHFGPEHPVTLCSQGDLAVAYQFGGHLPEAIALHEATLKLRESKLGLDHFQTLSSRNNLATAYKDAGRLSEAIAMHEESLKRLEAKLGPDHTDVLTIRGNLANAYYEVGRFSEAISIHEGTLKLREAKLGPDHPYTNVSRVSLANAYSLAGRLSDSIRLQEEAQAPGGQAGLGPPLHAHELRQPGCCLRICRPDDGGARAVRGECQVEPGQTRRRPPAHA